jgi:hypothetical protein
MTWSLCHETLSDWATWLSRRRLSLVVFRRRPMRTLQAVINWWLFLLALFIWLEYLGILP